MLFVEGITVRNFRSLNSVTIGVDKHGYGKPLTNVSCFLGKPNTGKSNFLDVFSFIQEVNSYGISYACSTRGGYDAIRTKGKHSPIEFEFAFSDIIGNKYKYLFSLDKDDRGNITKKEKLTTKIPYQNTPHIDYSTSVNQFFRNAFYPRFTDDGLVNPIENYPTLTLADDGNNFVSVMKRKSDFSEAERFFAFHIKEVLGIGNYNIIVTPEKNCENDTVLKQQFIAIDDSYKEVPTEDNRKSMSKGSLRYIANLVLCKSLTDFSTVCINNIECGIYFRLVEWLTEALKSCAIEARKNVFMITHSPYVLSQLKDEDVYIFWTNENGHTEVTRANTVPSVHQKMQHGDNLGFMFGAGLLAPNEQGIFPED